MKISRQAPARRRRSPFSFLPTLAAVLILGVLAWAWSKGGEKPLKPVEIAVPAETLGH